jgi:Alginate lyase
MTLVSESEADPIHSAIVRKEAWTLDPVRKMRADAERRMKEGPWSVTFDRPQGLDLDIHDFYSQAPYWWPQEDPRAPYVRRDGQINPNRFMANKNALNAMTDAVYSLGTAAFLLDEPRFAQRAARLIRIWFIDPKTRMNPDLEYAQSIRNFNTDRGAGVLEGRVFIRAIQGMEFLAQTGQWDPKEQAAVRKWFQEYLRWLTTNDIALDEKHAGNSHASWWTAQVAAIATFVEDEAAQKMAWAWYRDQVLGRQIHLNGSAPREEARSKSMFYSIFNLEAMATVCRIAQVNGVDLWNLQAKSGATLTTVIDYLQPYLTEPRKPPKEQVADVPNDGLYYLAFAGMGMKRPEYLAAYRKVEHPDNPWLNLVDLIASRWEASGHQTRH